MNGGVLEPMRLAFIGLGAMGYPIAGHLAKKYETLVWNRTFEKALAHAKEFGSKLMELAEVAQADMVRSYAVEVDRTHFCVVR
jgi:3-hydroxyisobutyrate dehydrogenase